MSTRILAVIILVAAFSATGAEAQETITWKDYGFTDSEPDVQTFALANGDTLRMSRYYFYQRPDSPDWPLKVLYCQGNFISRAGKQLFASGVCTHRDTDGDLQQELFEWSPAKSNGPFRIVEGTGKYADLDCTGEWSDVKGFGGPMNRWLGEGTMTCTRE